MREFNKQSGVEFTLESRLRTYLPVWEYTLYQNELYYLEEVVADALDDELHRVEYRLDEGRY